MSPPSFYGIEHSPWSERARWALDHHRIDYRKRTYVAMLSEPVLRARTGRLTGKMTAPVLIDGREVIGDSVDIARWAEARGHGSPLFGSEAIDTWLQRSERLLDAGRALATQRTAADDEALASMVPAPKAIRRKLLFVGKLGAQFLARKYDFEGVPAEQLENTLAVELEALRAGLGGREHLVGNRLSFADITCACALHFVEPVSDQWIKLGYHPRRTMRSPELAEEFDDLIQWRDRLYQQHR